MSYESAVAGLKALMKRELFDLEPDEHKARVTGESDRAAIILLGAMLERVLVARLTDLMPTINSDERSFIFQFEGPCGSFSNRIRMAQALGIIDRKSRRRLDLIREMRNVAAHAHDDVGFHTPEIREAVIALFDAQHRDIVEEMAPLTLRRAFECYCGNLSFKTGDECEEVIDDLIADLRAMKARVLGDTSPEKSPPKTPRDHPRKGETRWRHKSPR